MYFYCKVQNHSISAAKNTSGKEKQPRLCCCSCPTFIYNLLSLQFVLHRPSAADIIDVSIRETAADWRWRSIPLHLACVVSTCLSLRQTLGEIVWSWDEKGLFCWSELGGLQRDWAHRFDLHPASRKNGHSSDIRLDFSDTWACKACSLSSPSCLTFTQLHAVTPGSCQYKHSCHLFGHVYITGP